MSKAKGKVRRYSNLIKYVRNWPEYIWRKSIGFKEYFEFDIKNFRKVKVRSNTMGPFRENFFDGIYLSKLPEDQFSKKDLSVVDIGANIGYFSLNFLSKYPQAKIYAFEPHPYCYKLLEEYKEEFADYDLNIYQQAVGEKNDKLVINTSTLDGFATMSSIFENENKNEKFEVESITLESFVQEKGLDRIDLLKMDCEGSEYPILYSASRDLIDKIGAMCIETHLGKNENENISSLVTFIKGLGFKIEYLDKGETGYIWAWK